VPNLRSRKARLTSLNAAAVAWVASTDADRFFGWPNYPAYAGEVTKLPGAKPWWNPLQCIWLNHSKGEPLPAPTDGDDAALEFVLELHAEWQRRQRIEE
jgi:hypothetical protein